MNLRLAFCLLSVTATGIACTQSSKNIDVGSTKFQRADYGETPKASKSRRKDGAATDDDRFLSLLSTDGTPRVGVTNKATTIADDELECNLPAGTLVYLVAEQRTGGDDYYIAQLAEPCKPGAGLYLAQNKPGEDPNGTDSNGKDGPGSNTDGKGNSDGNDVDGNNNGHNNDADNANGKNGNDTDNLGEGNVPKSDIDVMEPGAEPPAVDEQLAGTGCSSVLQFQMAGGVASAGPGALKLPGTATEGCAYDPTATEQASAPTADELAQLSPLEKLRRSGGNKCMIPGQLIRTPAAPGGQMALRIFAKGKTVKIKTISKQFTSKNALGTTPGAPIATKNDGLYGDVFEFPEASVDLAKYQTDNDDEYEVPFAAFIPTNSWVSREVEMTVTAYDAKGQAGEKACHHGLRMASPIVLDFSGAEMIETTPLALSAARFDLDADGVAEQTGWIRAQDGLLALDINHNGKIDNGGELFGEATRLPGGGTARDGYEAMAQYDVGSKGALDRSDPIFAHLVVWFDRDGDGRSEGGEVVAATTLGLTRISVVPESVPAGLAFQDAGLGQGNFIPYRARFEGPASCPAGGCWSYDVYFGTLKPALSSAPRR